MKKILLLLLIVATVLTACQPDELLPYTAPEGSVNAEKLEGDWKVARVTITDQTAVEKNFPYKTIDATADFDLDKMVLQIGDGTFTVAYNGAAPVFNVTAGTWTTDNNEKPGQVTFASPTDTLRAVLGSYTTFQTGKMVLRQNKTLEGKVVTIYEYELQKQ
jgi:hypothetical protein